MSIGMAYNIKKRMAKGGMNCAHGGPAYCNAGCYAEGGMVKSAPEASKEALSYEESTDEPMNEMPNMPQHLKEDDMDSKSSMASGDMEDEMEPMKMAKGGFMKAKPMVKMMMKGGMVNSSEAIAKAQARTDMIENNSGGPSDNEDIDVAWTTPHDDNLSSEGDYPLMEEEGYTEGHQAKMRRKGGMIERVMSKLHSK